MNPEIKTLLFDFRLRSRPTEAEVTEQIIQPLEAECFSKSDKFGKLSAVKIPQRNGNVQTYIFESDTSDIFLTIRLYDDIDNVVLLTLLIELKR